MGVDVPGMFGDDWCLTELGCRVCAFSCASSVLSL